jgi:hypothetical protein
MASKKHVEQEDVGGREDPDQRRLGGQQQREVAGSGCGLGELLRPREAAARPAPARDERQQHQRDAVDAEREPGAERRDPVDAELELEAGRRGASGTE